MYSLSLGISRLPVFICLSVSPIIITTKKGGQIQPNYLCQKKVNIYLYKYYILHMSYIYTCISTFILPYLISLSTRLQKNDCRFLWWSTEPRVLSLCHKPSILVSMASSHLFLFILLYSLYLVSFLLASMKISKIFLLYISYPSHIK